MCENHTGKCLCSYCSGSIAKGMNQLNEKHLAQCQQFIENSNLTENNFHELSNLLDNLNPVQCFDILNRLCEKYSSTESHPVLDELIMKFLVRYRTNGGFFLALKQPVTNREYLLKRLMNSILVNNVNAQKANLTLNDIDQ